MHIAEFSITKSFSALTRSLPKSQGGHTQLVMAVIMDWVKCDQSITETLTLIVKLTPHCAMSQYVIKRHARLGHFTSKGITTDERITG
jgi:hypothetical protein